MQSPLTRALILALVVIAALGCDSKSPAAPPAELHKVTIGIQISPAMALPMVAKDKGLFAAEGLDVDLKEFTAGKFALQAFLTSSIDYAVSGEVPPCLATLQGNKLRVVAQVVEKTVNEVRLVAKREPGMTTALQFFRAKRRKLATSFGGGPEFFTYSFLRQIGIGKDEVEIISQKPEDMPAALEAGSVDAIAVFDPFAFIAEKRLGDKAITYSEPGSYSELYVLNVRPEQLVQDEKTIKSILTALHKAGELVARDPAAAKEVVRKYTKLDSNVIDGIWGSFDFKLALTPQLLEAWKAQAAWARETGKVTPGTPEPDFAAVIVPDALRAVAPSAVKFK